MRLLAWIGGTWSTLVGLFLLSLILPRRIIRIWHARPRWLRRYQRPTRVTRARPEGMPGHLEYVGEIGNPAADETFGDIAEQLLDDGFADMAERLGWMR